MAISSVVRGNDLRGSKPEPDATHVGLTLCGLENLLPVTPALRAAHPALAALPEVHDLRGRFSSNEHAYTWALENLMQRVDQSVGWSAGRSHLLDTGNFVWQGSLQSCSYLRWI